MNKKPNIVFILSDQQRTDTIAALGHPHMDTPHLDGLVRRGTSLTSVYVNAPSCTPSRAALFTGTYPHTNGVLRNDDPWSFTWVEFLAEVGYRCVNVGKMHTTPKEAPLGFHERHVVENKDRDHPDLPFYLDNWDKAFWNRRIRKPSRVSYREREDYRDCLGAFTWEPPEDLHPDVFVGDLAKLWLDRYPGDEPFFLQVGLPGPHPPYDPTERYLKPYMDKDLPKPILGYDLDTQTSQMKWLREHNYENDHDAIVHLPNPTEKQLHRQRAHYYANCTMIDDQVGKIIEALSERGVLENTVIIFTSDHGDCLNDHGQSQKFNMYENSVRVPAILAGPGVPEDMRIDSLVSLFDLGPTILETAGVEPPEWMEAESLWPQMIADGQARDRVFSEHVDDKLLQITKGMTMIRKDRWKLVHFVESDEGQLFDLTTDPDETINLWDDATHAKTRSELVSDILNWRLMSEHRTQNYRHHLAGVAYARLGTKTRQEADP